ncbi:MAG: metallophosphoesterase family protein [Clostridia bacterium]|nr:metallophosphoesterase family protein [Clostridia bacterium]
MKFIIISDSHGDTDAIYEAVRRRGSKDDGILFLGDGIRDAETVSAEERIPLFAVRGNCDMGGSIFGEDYGTELTVTFEGVKILMIHGNLHGVSNDGLAAADYARYKGADILLFGHTHIKTDHGIPADDGKKAIHIFNPGSISRPRDGSASFGTLEMKDGSFIFGHGIL